ncbi:MAG: aminodeoxychorismate synthase component I [Gammaproteobacteria bacterium SHHR-1]
MRLRIQPLDYPENAADLFAPFAAEPWAVFLDSAGQDRFDIIAARPSLTLTTWGQISQISQLGDPAVVRESRDSPFELLRSCLPRPPLEPGELPLPGCLIGYFGYDLARPLMGLPEGGSGHGFPDLAFGRYDWLILVDHQQRRAELRGHAQALSEAQWQGLLRQLQGPLARTGDGPLRALGQIQASLDETGYAQAFAAVQGYIREGDCYQINLARRFQAQVRGDAWLAYKQLRGCSPAPFGAYLNLPWGQLLSNSPEAFLRLRANRVSTSPIKGTRPRRAEAEQDRAALAELEASAKDRAENLMIVDLLRNDLGRSCAFGSIRVDRLFRPASFANVHHLVSDISGRLRPGEDALSLMANCFPGGSITGAPKRRAMQIIAQLEPARRGPYCGSLAYLGPDGSMTSNILIRSLLRQGEQAWFWAGGGLVADSLLADELAETEQKASILKRLLLGELQPG